MKRMILTVVMVLLCGLWVYAQESQQSQSSQSSQSQTGAANQTSVRGCVSGSSGNYTLTADSGQKYHLSGDTSKLTEHVGHEVQITGTTSESSASSTSATGTSEPTLTVGDVKHISNTCSTPSSSTPPQ